MSVIGGEADMVIACGMSASDSKRTFADLNKARTNTGSAGWFAIIPYAKVLSSLYRWGGEL